MHEVGASNRPFVAQPILLRVWGSTPRHAGMRGRVRTAPSRKFALPSACATISLQGFVSAAMAVPRCPALRSSIAAHARPLTLLCFCVVTCTVLELQHWDWPPPRLARRPRRPGPRRAVQPPPARALLGSPGVLPPPPPPPPPPPAHPSPHDNTFVQVGGQILFVRQGRRHHVPSCSPCSFRFTMCPSDPSPRTKVPVRILSPGNPHVAALPQGPTFSCAWTPEYGRDGEFAHVGPRIMFIGGGKKHHVIACRPCGPGFTVCDPRPGERTAPPLSLSSAELAVAHELTEGDRWTCVNSVSGDQMMGRDWGPVRRSTVVERPYTAGGGGGVPPPHGSPPPSSPSNV